ncbi:MAG: polysaccharide deacetylase family protein, partial [Acidobacteria bacterium]|nr:polysaccharide deacetylase family protein [Acidobacteriota bacterium]
MKFSKAVLVFSVVCLAVSLRAQGMQRSIAITIDDLPVVAKNSDLKIRQKITSKLLSRIAKAGIPAIGFVNENKLYVDGKRVKAEVDLLRMWLDAGLELGNHTYSH